MDRTTNIHIHESSWLGNDELGTRYPDYLKTYDFQGDFVDDAHTYYATAATQGGLIDVGIPGWLWPADALKLYEMAYFAPGDVLEIGSFHGLSTSILGKALAGAGDGRRMLSLELDAANMAETRRHTAPTAAVHDYLTGDAVASCRELKRKGRRFGFAFVDHSHAFGLVRTACEDLKTLIPTGGFALFHDFNDARNGKDPDYGVYQAVGEAFADGTFSFCGVYGCTALYRRTEVAAAGETEPKRGLLDRLFRRRFEDV